MKRGVRRVAIASVIAVLRALYALVKVFVRPGRKIVMVSREQATLPLDFTLLRDRIMVDDPSVRVVVLAHPVGRGLGGHLRYAMRLISQMVHIAGASVLILDTYSVLASNLRHRPALQIIQIWHALGIFKKFGFSAVGTAEGRDPELARGLRMHQGYDHVLVSGPACIEAFAEAFRTPSERISVMPLPRVDALLDAASRRSTRARIFAKYPELESARVVLFAPTFRADGRLPDDLEELDTMLRRNGHVLVLKLHPILDETALPSGLGRYPEFTTQEMMTVADVFVTDYSSALFEAALLGLPMVFLAPDLDEYVRQRDFYFNYRETVPGPVTNNVVELTQAIIENRFDVSAVTTFAQQYVQRPEEGGATEGLSRFLLRLLDQ